MIEQGRAALGASNLTEAESLFRQAVAQDLINETCLSNAAYALGTGLAEIVEALVSYLEKNGVELRLHAAAKRVTHPSSLYQVELDDGMA